jgi:hypothetical protein
MLWARVFVRWFRRDLWERAIPVVFIAIAGVLGTVMIWRAQREVDAGTLQDLAFMESIAPENGKLLVSPFEISLGYVNAHYPMRWAYPPSDCRSLRLLDEREQVGTMVMQDGDDTTEMLEGCGLPLRRDANREYRGATYRILRR